MGKGAKIALGCGCIVLLVAAGLVAVFGFGAFWAKSKLTELSGGFDKVTERAEEIRGWSEKANAVPYTAPSDGVIAEQRFLQFLETRKRVHSVYEGYEADLRQLQARSKNGSQPSFSEALATGGRFAEALSQLKLAQVKALAELGMSEAEYRDIQMAVYKTAWTAAAQEHSGQLPSEVVGNAGGQAEEAVAKTMAEAAEKGVPGAGEMSDEQRRQLGDAAGRVADTVRAAEAPQANIELFRKHEADIRKYAMSGLELLGL